MPRYMVTVGGSYSLEQEVDADNEEQAVAAAVFDDFDLDDILREGTWDAYEVDE